MDRQEWNGKLKLIFKEKADINCEDMGWDCFDDSFDMNLTPLEAFEEEISCWD